MSAVVFPLALHLQDHRTQVGGRLLLSASFHFSIATVTL
jgi:hypothetical protein